MFTNPESILVKLTSITEPPVLPRASSMERFELTQSELTSMAKAKLRKFACGDSVNCSASANVGGGTFHAPSLLQLMSISLGQGKGHRRVQGRRHSRFSGASADSLTPVEEKCHKSRSGLFGDAPSTLLEHSLQRGKDLDTSTLVQRSMAERLLRQEDVKHDCSSQFN